MGRQISGFAKFVNVSLRPAGAGIVNLLGESRMLDELDDEQGCCGLCGLLDDTDVVPHLEGAGPPGAVVGCRHSVARREEEVVDLIVGGEGPLSVAGRPSHRLAPAPASPATTEVLTLEQKIPLPGTKRYAFDIVRKALACERPGL